MRDPQSVIGPHLCHGTLKRDSGVEIRNGGSFNAVTSLFTNNFRYWEIL